jgi:hypothetical protein
MSRLRASAAAECLGESSQFRAFKLGCCPESPAVATVNSNLWKVRSVGAYDTAGSEPVLPNVPSVIVALATGWHHPSREPSKFISGCSHQSCARAQVSANSGFRLWLTEEFPRLITFLFLPLPRWRCRVRSPVLDCRAYYWLVVAFSAGGDGVGKSPDRSSGERRDGFAHIRPARQEQMGVPS